MKWFKKYATWCRKRGTNYVIRDRAGNEPYLERFYLIPRWLFLGLGRVVIHRFWKSDDDGGLHDHPWPWASLILEGGYYEYTPKGVKWRKTGDFTGLRRSTDLHRVELKHEGDEVWTLFFMGPRLREWGFVPYNSDGKWIHYKKYLEDKLLNKY